MEKPLVYLACPYTHEDPEVMKKRADIAAKKAGELIKKGFIVFSPLSHSIALAEANDLPESWEFWKEQDIGFLKCCNHVFVIAIDGWQESTGVTEEIIWARENNVPVTFIRGL